MQTVAWAVSDKIVGYEDAVAVMEERVAAIAAGRAGELVWLLEHPPVYTAGTSARAEDLVTPGRFPVIRTGRGGQFTYHGPGQRVTYAMLDLRTRGRDIGCYVRDLESWMIDTLKAFGVAGEVRDGRVGVWIRRPAAAGGGEGEDKIAAIGVRVKRWVTLHGAALNVDPDLEHFSGIVPCGVRDHGVTSLASLGRRVAMTDVDEALRRAFEYRFGPTRAAPAPMQEPAPVA